MTFAKRLIHSMLAGWLLLGAAVVAQTDDHFPTSSPQEPTQASVFPAAVPGTDGSITVHLTPSGLPHGWRFVRESEWHASGEEVGGLTTSSREIEFRPVPGYNAPPQQWVEIASGVAPSVLTFDYYDASAIDHGSLTLTLKPDSITTGPDRAQWRFLGDDDSRWHDSGETENTLVPGSYLIECKAVAGRSTPPIASVTIDPSRDRPLTLTYFLADASPGTPPAVLAYESVTTDTTKPYAYVGQVRSDTTVGSGFVVKPRVVLTAAHLVWDDGMLSSVQGLQWLFQRHRGLHEPAPLVPRGFYMFSSYSGMREVEDTPGTFSPASQNLDVAALYFMEDAGRGGHSGYVATDVAENEFLLSHADKMAVGYPIDGIAATLKGRMHATPPLDVGFGRVFGKTFTTADIHGKAGMNGGPLCVQLENGNYYPAAICLGGSGHTMVVRAIDSEVVELINSANSGIVDGGATHISVTPIEGGGRGALRIVIEPAAARNASAWWRLSPSLIARVSGYQISNLTPGGYLASLAPLDGYQLPGTQNIPIAANTLTTLTYTYQAPLTPQESWRQLHFGTTANDGDAADDADPDHDGFNNLAEYTADTLPTSAADFLRSQNPTRGTGTFSLSTAGRAGRTYVLERSTALLPSSWAPAAMQGPLAADGSVTLTDTSAPATHAFYRIRVTGP